jgi:hypothetical protein
LFKETPPSSWPVVADCQNEAGGNMSDNEPPLAAEASEGVLGATECGEGEGRGGLGAGKAGAARTRAFGDEGDTGGVFPKLWNAKLFYFSIEAHEPDVRSRPSDSGREFGERLESGSSKISASYAGAARENRTLGLSLIKVAHSRNSITISIVNYPQANVLHPLPSNTALPCL